MNCSDLQDKISEHVDGTLSIDDSSVVERHFDTCPLCRQEYDDLREIRRGLRSLTRPSIPSETARNIRLSILEATHTRRGNGISPAMRDWLQMRLMPLTVGLAASLIVGVSLLASMMSGGLAIDQYAARNTAAGSSVMIAGGPSRHVGIDEISPVEFARGRTAFAGDSPSINPQGTLAALSETLNRNGIRNDEVVVVADVFSNGLARIAEVVEPSRNDHAVNELQRALDADLADAPFVPASMDNRSDSVRVVLKFRSVEVNSREKKKRR